MRARRAAVPRKRQQAARECKRDRARVRERIGVIVTQSERARVTGREKVRMHDSGERQKEGQKRNRARQGG